MATLILCKAFYITYHGAHPTPAATRPYPETPKLITDEQMVHNMIAKLSQNSLISASIRWSLEKIVKKKKLFHTDYPHYPLQNAKWCNNFAFQNIASSHARSNACANSTPNHTLANQTRMWIW